jgi:hypothetical protein
MIRRKVAACPGRRPLSPSPAVAQRRDVFRPSTTVPLASAVPFLEAT